MNLLDKTNNRFRSLTAASQHIFTHTVPLVMNAGYLEISLIESKRSTIIV